MFILSRIKCQQLDDVQTEYTLKLNIFSIQFCFLQRFYFVRYETHLCGEVSAGYQTAKTPDRDGHLGGDISFLCQAVNRRSHQTAKHIDGQKGREVKIPKTKVHTLLAFLNRTFLCMGMYAPTNLLQM